MEWLEKSLYRQGVLMYFRILCAAILLSSCSLIPNLGSRQYNSYKLCRIGYNIHKDSIPLKKNTLQFSYMYGCSSTEICYDGAIARVVVTISQTESRNILVEVLTEHCYDDVSCEFNRDSVIVQDEKDSLSYFIRALKAEPLANCIGNPKRNSSFEWGPIIRVVDENGFLINILNNCLVDDLPIGSMYIEAKIRDFILKIPVIKNNMPYFSFAGINRTIELIPPRAITIDSIMVKEKSIFLPTEAVVYSKSREVNLSNLEFYWAFQQGDSVEYLFHKRNELGSFLVERKIDADTMGFKLYQEKLSNYSTEVFYANCPEEIEKIKTIYWTNNHVVNHISFGILENKTKIYFIEKELESWFKSKIK